MQERNTSLRITTSQVARFWAKVSKSEQCWEWRGKHGSNGYGQTYLDGRYLQAHRLAYALEIGPIPRGLVIDHLCRNRNCVNPTHLEAVTQKENVRRGLQGVLHPHHDVCAKGHRIEGDNAMPMSRGLRGNPRCRQCNRDYMRNYMRDRAARIKAAKLAS